MSNIGTNGELIIELEKELHYHMNVGTTYRIKTTQLSIQVVNRTIDINCFYDRQHS